MNIKLRRRGFNLLVTFLLAGLITALSGCIVGVIQPETAFPGQVITTELQIVPETSTPPDLVTPSLYIGARFPSGWNVVDDPIYYGGPTGTLVYSPTLVGLFESELGMFPDTYWWVGSSPHESWSTEVTVTTIITIQVGITATGPYTLNYAAGTDGYGWPATSLDYMVTDTITIVNPQKVYLPIIMRK
jgi:hypothetical protein